MFKSYIYIYIYIYISYLFNYRGAKKNRIAYQSLDSVVFHNLLFQIFTWDPVLSFTVSVDETGIIAHLKFHTKKNSKIFLTRKMLKIKPCTNLKQAHLRIILTKYLRDRFINVGGVAF